VYDLPKGKGLDIKKSDKPPTQFKDFRNVDASWKVMIEKMMSKNKRIVLEMMNYVQSDDDDDKSDEYVDGDNNDDDDDCTYILI
jgi:hypothetical protein